MKESGDSTQGPACTWNNDRCGSCSLPPPMIAGKSGPMTLTMLMWFKIQLHKQTNFSMRGRQNLHHTFWVASSFWSCNSSNLFSAVFNSSTFSFSSFSYSSIASFSSDCTRIINYQVVISSKYCQSLFYSHDRYFAKTLWYIWLFYEFATKGACYKWNFSQIYKFAIQSISKK